MQNWLSNFYLFSFQSFNFQFCQFSPLTFNFCQFKALLLLLLLLLLNPLKQRRFACGFIFYFLIQNWKKILEKKKNIKGNDVPLNQNKTKDSGVGSSPPSIEPRERATVTCSSSPRSVPKNHSHFSAPLSLGSRVVNWRTSSPISLTPSPIPRLSLILSLTVADLF